MTSIILFAKMVIFNDGVPDVPITSEMLQKIDLYTLEQMLSIPYYDWSPLFNEEKCKRHIFNIILNSCNNIVLFDKLKNANFDFESCLDESYYKIPFTYFTNYNFLINLAKEYPEKFRIYKTIIATYNDECSDFICQLIDIGYDFSTYSFVNYILQYNNKHQLIATKLLESGYVFTWKEAKSLLSSNPSMFIKIMTQFDIVPNVNLILWYAQHNSNLELLKFALSFNINVDAENIESDKSEFFKLVDSVDLHRTLTIIKLSGESVSSDELSDGE